jgi:hypothetical protein
VFGSEGNATGISVWNDINVEFPYIRDIVAFRHAPFVLVLSPLTKEDKRRIVFINKPKEFIAESICACQEWNHPSTTHFPQIRCMRENDVIQCVWRMLFSLSKPTKHENGIVYKVTCKILDLEGNEQMTYTESTTIPSISFSCSFADCHSCKISIVVDQNYMYRDTILLEQ